MGRKDSLFVLEISSVDLFGKKKTYPAWISAPNALKAEQLMLVDRQGYENWRKGLISIKVIREFEPLYIRKVKNTLKDNRESLARIVDSMYQSPVGMFV